MRRIWLSINIAEDAVADENKLEALAFSMLIKTKFVSSVFKDATVRRCNEVFGMGSTRSNRLINNGLKYGYLKRSGKDIIATKIRDKGLNNKLFFNPGAVYSISQLKDKIRETVLLNKIKKQSWVLDTINKAKHPKNLTDYRKRIGKRYARTMTANDGISVKRIMQVTNTKKYRAKRIANSLVNSMQISKTIRFVNTDIDANGFNHRMAIEGSINSNVYLKIINIPTEENNQIVSKNTVCYQLANSYKYTSNTIHYVW